MAVTELRGRLSWQLATVIEVIAETPRTKSIVLDAPGWCGHQAGQHVDVRLAGPHGYGAHRSFSIASAPMDGYLMLTVARIDGGEVSAYLLDDLGRGDELELRGPLGEHFVWDATAAIPVMLVAGGSGVVPFRSMLRHWSAGPRMAPVRLLYSARTLDDVIYRDELLRLAAYEEVEIHFVLTRERSDSWRGLRRRIDRSLLRDVLWPPMDRPLIFVCGPSGFVQTVAAALLDDGHEPGRIRIERFEPTGR